MMIENDSVEFEGKTVEEAVSKAVSKLGVSKESLLIKVVCEESKGLFGMRGAKQAKIKASVRKR